VDKGVRSPSNGVEHHRGIHFSVLPHGATGTWLDEILEFGLPLIILIILYVWSSRKPKEKHKSK
jgi:hypothetical protein